MEVDGKAVVAVKDLVPQEDTTLLALTFFVADGAGQYTTHSDAAVLRHWSEPHLLESAARAGLARSWTVGDFAGQPYEAAAASDLIACFARE